MYEKSKIFWSFFLLIFIINIIALNWGDISWIFSPRVALTGLRSLFLEEEAMTIINSNNEESNSFTGKTTKENSIEISSIGIMAPIVIPGGDTNTEIYNALKYGVVHFPNSPFPGERGVSILLGHSSPPGWPRIDYEWVFTEVQDLKKGDEIEVYFNGELFVYTIIEQIFLEVGEQVPNYYSNEKEIILISCWPPGRNIKRIGIRGLLTK